MCLQFHNTDTFSLLRPYPFSSLSLHCFGTHVASNEAFVKAKITLFVLCENCNRFASLSSAKHKEFQIHGGWVQKLVVDTHPAQPRPPTRRPGCDECGYIWNANDAAPASKTVDAKSISLAIDAVAEQQGSLDACSTVKMGRLLAGRRACRMWCSTKHCHDFVSGFLKRMFRHRCVFIISILIRMQ